MSARHQLAALICVAVVAAQSPPPPPTRLHIGDESVVTTTCAAHFNTPCAIHMAHELVDDLILKLGSATTPAAVAALLDDTNNGQYNDDFNFWSTVYNATGAYVACGRPYYSSEFPAGSDYVGQSMESVENAEAGFVQEDLWSRIVLAAQGDGYYVHVAHDRYAGHARTFHPAAKHAVTRVGYVKSVQAVGHGTLYVSSSFSDMPYEDGYTSIGCDWRYDSLCSISYTRRVLGKVTTRMLSAGSLAELETVFAATTWREYNEQNKNSADAGFYPFVVKFDGVYMAHGANPSLTGKTVPNIINGSAVLRELHASPSELHLSFVTAASDGGGWVGYYWRNAADAEPYLKIALVVGVHRFGVDYYVGVGFNHQMPSAMEAPHCSNCRQNYNYPCAWANVLHLVGHVVSLLFMANRHTLDEALSKITWDPEYGGGGVEGRPYLGGSSDWLYAFVYDFNGTAVANGAAPATIGRSLWDIIDGSDTLRTVINATEFHNDLVTAATHGGRWVPYEWKNSGDAFTYRKISYVTGIVRDGRSYYVGIGLAENDWRSRQYEDDGVTFLLGGGTSRWLWGCSADFLHPCAEDWAVAVAGARLDSILTAKTHSDLVQTFATTEVLESPYGFYTHVHNTTHVLWDGPSAVNAVGMPLTDWLQQVGLSATDLDGYDAAGSWLGPFDITDRDSTGSFLTTKTSRYILWIDMPIEDELADGVFDGVGDHYTILVMVAATSPTKPPKLSAPTMSVADIADGTCLKRPSDNLEGVTAPAQSSCVNIYAHEGYTSAASTTSDICGAEYTATSGNPAASWTGYTCNKLFTAWGDDQKDAADGACIVANADDCQCAEGYRAIFSAPRVLGDRTNPESTDLEWLLSNSGYGIAAWRTTNLSDDSALPLDAVCASANHSCEAACDASQGGSAMHCSSCKNRMALQVTYEVDCGAAHAYISGTTVALMIALAVLICLLYQRWAYVKMRTKLKKELELQLREKATGQKPSLEMHPKHVYMLFLSHVWSTGQDQVAVIKRRMQSLLPGARIFLDVEDLVDIGALERYVEETTVVLIFLSRGYFLSRNCMREVIATVEMNKPIVLVHETNSQKGGESLENLRQECPEEYRDAVFGPKDNPREVIPWRRIESFQLESLKLIATQTLAQMPKYMKLSTPAEFDVPGSLANTLWTFKTTHTLYTSPNNPGAAACAARIAQYAEAGSLEVPDAKALTTMSTSIKAKLPPKLAAGENGSLGENGPAGGGSPTKRGGSAKAPKKGGGIPLIAAYGALGGGLRKKPQAKPGNAIHQVGKTARSAAAIKKAQVVPAPAVTPQPAAAAAAASELRAEDVDAPPPVPPGNETDGGAASLQDAPVFADPEHSIFLLYLNKDVFVGTEGDMLADELRHILGLPGGGRDASLGAALGGGTPLVRVIMVHENDPAVGGCEFDRFFHVTPKDLVVGGLYKPIAPSHYPGHHQCISHAEICKAMSMVSKDGSKDEQNSLFDLKGLASDAVQATADAAMAAMETVSSTAAAVKPSGGAPAEKPPSSSADVEASLLEAAVDDELETIDAGEAAATAPAPAP